jgi:hypothetical protein
MDHYDCLIAACSNLTGQPLKDKDGNTLVALITSLDCMELNKALQSVEITSPVCANENFSVWVVGPLSINAVTGGAVKIIVSGLYEDIAYCTYGTDNENYTASVKDFDGYIPFGAQRTIFNKLITCIIPPGLSPQSIVIGVGNSNNVFLRSNALNGKTNNVTVYAPPIINKVSRSGIEGSDLVITGTGFQRILGCGNSLFLYAIPSDDCLFCLFGSALVFASVSNDTSITCTVPAQGTDSTVLVQVTLDRGMTFLPAFNFTYSSQQTTVDSTAVASTTVASTTVASTTVASTTPSTTTSESSTSSSDNGPSTTGQPSSSFVLVVSLLMLLILTLTQ